MALNYSDKIQLLIQEKICADDKVFDKEVTSCFTGHRPQKLSWGLNENDEYCKEIKIRLKYLIENAIKSGYTNFLCGMALGLDMIFAELVLDLKKNYPQIKLIAVLPCKTQSFRWNRTMQERYYSILSNSDKIWCKYSTYIGGKCMYERNSYLVKNSSLMFAVFNGSMGGTKKTIDLAIREGLLIKIVKPLDNYYSKLI